jgi:hypothetical protein
MAMVMIQHLSGGVWGVFRRVFEASSRTLPILVVLFVPVLLGVGSLYPGRIPIMSRPMKYCDIGRRI